MIIVPEIEKVFILVPRTASGSLYRSMQDKWPRSMLLYRHMEADGVPHGYDRWEKIGFMRQPTRRLWSLYHFQKRFDGGAIGANAIETARIRKSVERPFEDWLLNDLTVFSKNDGNGEGLNRPILTRRNAIPDARCSQWFWLRPDLGTSVYKYEHMGRVMEENFGLKVMRSHNRSEAPEMPMQGKAVCDHMIRFFDWDLSQYV